MVSSVTMEVELAGDTNTWTPLLDARTRHPLVSDINNSLRLLQYCRHGVAEYDYNQNQQDATKDFTDAVEYSRRYNSGVTRVGVTRGGN